MYICICKSVTDKQVRRAIAQGADNLYELRESLGVASGCGSCAASAQEILDQAAGSNPGPILYRPAPSL